MTNGERLKDLIKLYQENRKNESTPPQFVSVIAKREEIENLIVKDIDYFSGAVALVVRLIIDLPDDLFAEVSTQVILGKLEARKDSQEVKM